MFQKSILLLLCLFLACTKNAKEEKQATISLKNNLSLHRTQEIVHIPKEKILSILDTIAPNEKPVLLDEQNHIIPAQWDDSNDDGLWDELVTAIDFKPDETKTFHLKKILKNEIPNFKKYTNVYFGVGKAKPIAHKVLLYSRQGNPKDIDSLFFQMEGPAWENDKVGFRTYFDPRNGMDIFGKRTENLILSSVGLTDNYHTLANWGMDILKVGNSLGAGAIALKTNDTVTRITGIENTSFKILKTGPIKTTFEIIHHNTQIGNQQITVTNKISIAKGQWGYKREVSFSNFNEKSKLITGIVNLKPNTLSLNSYGNYQTIATYGKQSENNDNLGMAILVNTKDYTNQENASNQGEIINTYLVSMKISAIKPTSYYFLSGWELSDNTFKTKKGFETIVKDMALRLSNPIDLK